MLRGYRSIFLALVGWLILAAAPTLNSGSKAEEKQALQRVEQAPGSIMSSKSKISSATATEEYQDPCKSGEGGSRSDICAQWTAANAATESSNWAFWSMLVSIIGAIGIVIALYLTIDSNRIARSTAKHQLRAYVGVDRFEIMDAPGVRFYAIKIIFRNCGQTPAYIKSAKAASYLGRFPVLDPRSDGPEIEDYPHFSPIINPGCCARITTAVVSDDDWDAFRMAGEGAALFFYGRIDYSDIFDRPQSIQYSYRTYWEARNLPEDIDVCLTGNKST